MTLEQIVEIADEAYEDGTILNYHEDPGGEHGDTLAEFIAVELRETFDPGLPDSYQLDEAQRVMEVAEGQLRTVAEAFEARAIYAHLKKGMKACKRPS